MLREHAVDDATDVGHDPALWPAESREPAVDDNEIPVGEDDAVQRRRRALDEVEQAVAARRDVRAVLDVVWRPVPGSCA